MKENMKEKFNKYYLKTRNERIDILREYVSFENYKALEKTEILSNEIANNMIENQISVLGLPLGLATNFVINNEEYVIPMAVEEPSVIAAASNAAKLLGNIEVDIKNREVIGQIALYDIKKDINEILAKKEELLQIANSTQEQLVKLGGGARDIKVEKKGKFCIIYLYVDTLDAMGANMVNTMLESISQVVVEILEAKKLMSILSNYSTECLVEAKAEIKVEKNFGEKMTLACEFANVDVYRATTNNKGIFNGIDALAIATGNDWRAIEAAGHAYASRSGQYSSLTTWTFDGEKLRGNLIIPMAIATFGGSIGLNPASKIALDILKNPDAKELSKIAVALGLAQNFAALRALVTVGIQKGHMKLHAKSIASFIGAKENEREYVIQKMIEKNKINIEEAKKILGDLRNGSHC
ncbi:hydroxymethylglutaryl-CoA reductase, degradative [Sneathia sanguinegens]|uniref:hydroxymethylglutaryl-CoA reductase, degradative n=1 Tax=Sneathia sanguinegens TaxID=40543 RepID=UPI0023F86B5A|nr:hydroxymethylglutaryl-CoA reductase, degradative [Sneathia sanguinegens]